MTALAEALASVTNAVGTVGSLWLLAALLLVVNGWAITLVLASAAAPGEKALWTAVILAVPILGPVAWYVLGPKPNLIRGEKTGRSRAASEDAGA